MVNSKTESENVWIVFVKQLIFLYFLTGTVVAIQSQNLIRVEALKKEINRLKEENQLLKELINHPAYT